MKTKIKLLKGYEFTLTEKWEKEQAQKAVNTGVCLTEKVKGCRDCIFYGNPLSVRTHSNYLWKCVLHTSLIPKKYKAYFENSKHERVPFTGRNILNAMGYYKEQ